MIDRERKMCELDQRRKSEKQLRQAEELFEKLFHSSPVAIAISHMDGRLLNVNDKTLTLFGFIRDEMIGRTVLELNIWVHSEDRVMVEALLRDRPSAREIEIEYRTKSGEIHNVLTSFQTIEIDGEDRVLTLFQDITRQRQAEEALNRSQAAEHEQRVLAEAQRDIAAILTVTLDLSSAMNLILETVGRVVPHDAASIMLIEGDVARVAHSHGYPSHVVSLFETYRFPLINLPNLRQMIETGNPYLVADTGAASEWANLAVPGTDWSRSFVSAPIRTRGRVIGFLNLDSALPGYYTSTHAERLQTFADQVSVASQNAILYDEVSRHAAELEERVAQRTVELERVKEHVEAILNTSGDGIIVIDSEGNIQQANPAFSQMFNFTGEVRHQSFQAFLEPSEREKYAATLFNVTQQRQPERLELMCVRKDGTVFDVDAMIAPLMTGTDADVRIVCNLRDISERKRLEAEIREALERQKELNELKLRFCMMASHEVRTPLTIIHSSTELLRSYRERMSVEQQLEHLKRIETQVLRLTELVESVLTIGQADRIGMAFNPERLNMESFCQTVVDEIRLTVSTHEIRFNVNGNCEQAAIDPKLMRQVLYNLLSNAIKYSPQGSVVYLNLTCNHDVAIIGVTDEGIGIPEADSKHLFEVFHRASNVGNIQGTGLGLAIVKRAVEAHHGSISVESAVGKGTTFIVNIPLTLPK